MLFPAFLSFAILCFSPFFSINQYAMLGEMQVTFSINLKEI